MAESDRLFQKNVLAAFRALGEAEAHCERIPINSTAESADAEWSGTYVNLYLDAMGHGLGDAVRAWCGQPVSVYFWPGYEQSGRGRLVVRQKLSEAAKRSSADEAQPDRLPLDEIYELGSGSIDRDTVWSIDANSLWFNNLLNREISELPGFVPGSTHRWLRETISRGSPNFLAIEVKDEPSQQIELASDLPGYGARITLPKKAASSWTRIIRDGIAEVWREREGRDAKLEPWPWPSGDQASDDLRFAQYDAWLRGCFEPEATMNADFLQPLERAINALPDAVATAENKRGYIEKLQRTQEELKFIRGDQMDQETYRAWYAFRLFEPVSAIGQAQGGSIDASDRLLGTAMFLTSEYIDSACLQMIAGWVRVMYMQLRKTERQVELSSGKRLFEKQLWPSYAVHYFEGIESDIAPHSFDDLKNESDTARMRLEFDTYLRRLFRIPNIPFDTGTPAVHSALKGLVGGSSRSHRGAAENGVPGVGVSADWQSDPHYGLNIGSLAILLGAATQGNNDWLRSMKWPTGNSQFQPCSWLQTPRQQYKLVMALAGSDILRPGLFRHLAMEKRAGELPPLQGIRKVDLDWDSLRIHLSWDLNRGDPKNPDLWQIWRHELPDEEPAGEFRKALARLFAELVRSETGLRTKTLIRFEQDAAGTVLEFVALPSEFWDERLMRSPQ